MSYFEHPTHNVGTLAFDLAADVTRCGDHEVHLIGVAVDVSEQQDLARRSDEANEQLNSAIENISETFVLCDNRDRVVLCNSKYR